MEANGSGITGSEVCVESLVVAIPKNGGLLLNLQGSKHEEFTVKHAKMRLIGEEFWKVLSKVLGPSLVATFKLAFHPIVLSHDSLLYHEFEKGRKSFSTSITFGAKGGYTAKKSTVEKKLRKLVEKGDPTCEVELEYGESTLTSYKKEGILFSIVTRPSQILESATNHTNLIKIARHSTNMPTNTPQVDKEPTIVPTITVSPPDDKEDLSLLKRELRKSVGIISKYIPELEVDHVDSNVRKSLEILKLEESQAAKLLQELNQLDDTQELDSAIYDVHENEWTKLLQRVLSRSLEVENEDKVEENKPKETHEEVEVQQVVQVDQVSQTDQSPKQEGSMETSMQEVETPITSQASQDNVHQPTSELNEKKTTDIVNSKESEVEKKGNTTNKEVNAPPTVSKNVLTEQRNKEAAKKAAKLQKEEQKRMIKEEKKQRSLDKKRMEKARKELKKQEKARKKEEKKAFDVK